MGYLVSYAVPVIPGKGDRVRNYQKELEERGLWEDYLELNRRATCTRQCMYLQDNPDGSQLAIVVMELDDPMAAGRAFEETPYDRYWTDFLSDVHGFPNLMGVPLEQQPTPPPAVFVWEG